MLIKNKNNIYFIIDLLLKYIYYKLKKTLFKF